MADELKFNITKRETIKPSSPTSQHLRNLKLSLLDQIFPNIYVPIVLFYPLNNNISNHHQSPIEVAYERLTRLRETLPEALTHFYPLPGRLISNHFFECNDEGVEFVEAQAPFPMSKILREPVLDTLWKLVPAPLKPSEELSFGHFLLLVQATAFNCGGIALGLSVSHKIADASTDSAFINTWARISRGKPITEPLVGKALDLFPPVSDLSTVVFPEVEIVRAKSIATRRYHFSAEKITALKGIAGSEAHVANPTRVEVVSSLIWKCALEARSANSAASKKSIWVHTVNLRKRVVPPLEDNVVGNLVGSLSTTVDNNGGENRGLKILVSKFRRAIQELGPKYVKTESCVREAWKVANGFKELAMNSDKNIDYYNCTSWCRLGFYEADFGWEKPTWVTAVCTPCENSVVLMDSGDGNGIEAWLMFGEEDMALIESNQDLLAFASLNPSVI